MAIAFACPGCGKRFKVGDEKAGRKGKCPGCDTVFQIPAAAETAPARPAPQPRRSREADDEDEREPPRRRPVAEEDDDRPRRRPVEADYDDGEYEEERPKKRRKKKKKGSPTGLILGLVGGAVGLLALIGLGIWLIVRMTGGSGAVADDLKYLPDNSQIFVSLNMDQITASELYKRLKQETTVLNNLDQQRVGDFAQDLADLERVTFAGLPNDNAVLGVVRGKKVFNLEELATKGKIKYPQEETFGRYKVRHDGFNGIAVVERKTVVVGPLAPLKKALERGGTKASLSAGLQSVFAELNFSKPVAAAMDLQAAANQPGQPGGGLPLPLPGQNPAAAPDSFTAHLDLGASASLSVTVSCKGPQEAEELKKMIDGGLAMFRGPIPFPGAPPELMEIAKKIQITASGNKVSLSLSVDNNTLVEMAKKAPNLPGR